MAPMGSNVSDTKSALVARRVEPVPLPSGHTAHVRTLSLAEFRAVSRAVADAGDGPDAGADALVSGVIAFACDPAGRALYLPTDRAEVEALPVEVLRLLDAAGGRLNGFTEAAVAAGKADSPATSS